MPESDCENRVRPQGLTPGKRGAILAGIVVIAIVGGVLLPAATSTTAAAQATATGTTNASDVAPYYENRTAGVDSDSWLPSPANASLDTIGELITRIGPAVLGTGGVDESGTGFVGVILTGLLMAAAAFMTLLGTGAGPVGGVVAALVTGYTLVELGLAPPWVRTLLLFGVGMLVAVAGLRIWRS